MPPSRSREDRDAILEEIAAARRKVAEEDDGKLDRVEKLLRFLQWICAGVVAITLFVAKLYWKVEAHDKTLESIVQTVTPKVWEMWWMKERGINNKP